MTRCSVPDCMETGGHRFPRHAVIRKLWLQAIRCENLEPTEATRICRLHFTDDDYVKIGKYTGVKNQHSYLKKTAVPSIFPWTTPKIEKETWSNSNITTFKKINASIGAKTKNSTGSITMCCIGECCSKVKEGVILHSFPRKNPAKNKWVKILNIPDKNTSNLKVCSFHFKETDYIYQVDSAKKILKRQAVPSQNIPNGPIKIKLKRSYAMTDKEDKCYHKFLIANLSHDKLLECRVCLIKRKNVNSFCYLFQEWSPPWQGMGATIAEDLARIANVEVTEADTYPNSICLKCYQSLLVAARFASQVRFNDFILRHRHSENMGMKVNNDVQDWPKPILVDKNINVPGYDCNMEVDIKQEVLSEEEYGGENTMFSDPNIDSVDIKVEPEDIVSTSVNETAPEDVPELEKKVDIPPLDIKINGTMSLHSIKGNYIEANGTTCNTTHLNITVKQEPESEDEDIEPAADLPLDCMLCAKPFNSISGLKAHVIAQHSYKSVKRKMNSEVSPDIKRTEKYVCHICRRSFTTSTDLMVHETCHNKFACYSCNDKFDTFELLTKHRKRCKATLRTEVQRLKTLDDVIRPQLDNSKENSPIPEIVSVGPANIEVFQDTVNSSNNIEANQDGVDILPKIKKNPDVEDKQTNADEATVESSECIETNKVSMESSENLETLQDSIDEPPNIENMNKSLEIKIMQDSVVGPVEMEMFQDTSTSHTNIELNENIVDLHNKNEDIQDTVDRSPSREIILDIDRLDSKEVHDTEMYEDKIENTLNRVTNIETSHDADMAANIEGINDNITDEKMKLDLEIHTASNETQPMEFINDLKVESVCKDD